MDYQTKLADALRSVKDEGRYRVFADILRHRGDFPRATFHTPEGARDIVVWCAFGRVERRAGKIATMAKDVGKNAVATLNLPRSGAHRRAWSDSPWP